MTPFLPEVQTRFEALESGSTPVALDNRITAIENDVATAQGDITTAEGKITTLETFSSLSNFVVFAAGNFTTVGGDANESITVANMLGTDTCIVNVRTPGAAAKTIVSVTPGAGAIAVVMSNDPSNDHILSYLVLRAN